MILKQPGGPTVSIIHPSRGRPRKAVETYEYTVAQASGLYEIDYVFCVDDDDPETIDAMRKISSKNTTQVSVVINSGPRYDAVAAGNLAHKQTRGEVVVAGSDDVRPPTNWDADVVTRLGDLSKPAVLGVGDPHFSGPYSGDGLASIFIATRAHTKKIGDFIEYPEYVGMFVDNDWTQKAVFDDVLIDGYNMLWYHDWHGGENDPLRDATYCRHMTKERHEAGYAAYAKRSSELFPDVDPVTLDPLPFPEGSLRWNYQQGDYVAARVQLELLLRKYHRTICGGRFRFHAGTALWHELNVKQGGGPEFKHIDQHIDEILKG